MPVSNSKPTLLCLDTSTAACSVALLYKGSVYSRFKLASREHTRLLLPMIDEVLTEAGIDLSSVDALGFTVGPGSFTGVRIGFGIAQGLAYGAELPVIPVSTLESLAVAAHQKFMFSSGSLVMPILDARMDECYWALFRVTENQLLQRVADDSLSSPEQVGFEQISTQQVAPELISGSEKTVLNLVGDGCNYSDRFIFKATTVVDEFYPDANAVLAIAVNRFDAGRYEKIENVQPLYLRDKITWKKRQRLRDPKVTPLTIIEKNCSNKES